MSNHTVGCRGVSLAILGLLLLSGCGYVSEAYIADSAVVQSSKEPAAGTGAPLPFDLDKDRFPGETTGQPAYFQVVHGGGEQVLLRDRLQAVLLARSDKICRYHKGRILANAATWDFSTGFASTVLSAASAAVGGEVAKTILSSGSATASALGTGISASFYQNIVASAVVNEIEKSREPLRRDIEKKRGEDYKSYTVDDMVRDIQTYHDSCSFYVGLVALTKEKIEKPRTKCDLTAEIDALLGENEKLNKTSASSTADYKNRLEQIVGVNALEIQRLSTLRIGAPGTMLDCPSTPEQQSSAATGNSSSSESAPAAAPITPVTR